MGKNLNPATRNKEQLIDKVELGSLQPDEKNMNVTIHEKNINDLSYEKIGNEA